MKPYGEREPRYGRERHGCPCCDSYRSIKKRDRKPSKAKERRRGRKQCLAVAEWRKKEVAP